MGLYDRPYYQDEPRSSFSGFVGGRSMIANIIIVNVALYVLDVFLWPGEEPLNRLLAAKSDTLVRPWMWWQFLTYGFMHSPDNVFHLIFNMLGLFFLGREVELKYGSNAFLKMYLTALVICGVIWSATNLVMEENIALIGASGAVTTTVILFALNFPHRKVLFMMFIPIPAWVLGVMIVVFNLSGQYGPVRGDDARVAYDVHLLGAAYAFLYFKTGWDLTTLFMPTQWRGKFKMPSRRPKLKLHDPEDRYDQLDQQADTVLKKLHREGESSLSAKERRILEDYSRRMQQKHR